MWDNTVNTLEDYFLKTFPNFLHATTITCPWCGLTNNLTCRKCDTEEETSVHILCECEALASLRYTYLGSFFLDLEDIGELGMGAIWNIAKITGLL